MVLVVIRDTVDSVIDLLGTQYYDDTTPLMGAVVKAEALWVLYRLGGKAALATCGQAHVRNPVHLRWPS